MSPQEKIFELTISEKSEKGMSQIKKFLLPKKLPLKGLEEFLSNRFDAGSVSFTLFTIRNINTDTEFWVGNYLLKLTERKLAKDMYTPKKFDREI